MKYQFSIKHIIVELFFAFLLAEVFSLFAKDFLFWLTVFVIVLLIWHHYIEQKLLTTLNNFDKIDSQTNSLSNLSQSLSYYRNKSEKDKLKTLKLLEKLSQQIQYYADGIIICDKKGNIHWCNNTAQALFSFYWNQNVDKNINNVIFYPEFHSYFQCSSQAKRPLILLIGEQNYIEISIYQYNQYQLLISRNINQIVHLLNSRQNFIANMNHELRTPLTVLQGYLELLNEEKHSSSLQHKALDVMQQQCERMTRLLQQLDILAKVEASTTATHQRVNLSELAYSIQQSMQMINDHQHQLYFHISPHLYSEVNKDQIYSAMTNLINNAIKHAGRPCEINVVLTQQDQQIIFSVTDTGQGIKAEHIPHLTERFYRGDSSREKTKGSGLGLAIVKHILEQHQSKLIIDSEENKGSRFAFSLRCD